MAEDNPFGLPPRTMDVRGALLWVPSMEWTGGGLVSTLHDLASWGHVLFTRRKMDGAYPNRFLDAVPVSPEAPDIRHGTDVAICDDTPYGPVYGHGAWSPRYVSSLCHNAYHRVTVAHQTNTDVGIADDSTDLLPALEAVLSDLASTLVQGDAMR